MNRWRRHQAVMGTVVTFDIVTEAPQASTTEAVDEAMAWLRWVDLTFSTYRADSEVSRLDRSELALGRAHPEVRDVLQLCDELRRATDGWFDARAGGNLDPSGVVKGWAVERASELLHAAGWADHSVDAGGDIRLRGRPGHPGGWQVGIVHPARRDALCAAITVAEGAVATSGTYERGLHVIDPHRGRPAAALAAVTVVGPELTTTDAYATAALAMGDRAPDWLAALPGHEAFVIDAAGRGWETPGFGRLRRDLSAVASL